MTAKFKATSLLATASVWAALSTCAQTATAQTNDNLAVNLPVSTNSAVSALNGKVDYSGGDMNTSVGTLFDASLSLPLSQHLGFQADGMFTRVSNLTFGSGAGHLFWRNPDLGLLGLTGGYLYRDGVDTYQAGVEGEYYLGRFTLGVFGGVGSISYANPAPFIDSNPTRFVGRLSVDYYLLNNLRLGGTYTTAFRDNLGQGEIEYQTPIRGLALTGEVAYGDYGYHHWLFGLRYYFGGQKTLRDRQRQDDPPGLTRQILYDLGAYGAEFNHKEQAYLAATSSSGSSGNSGGGDYGEYGFNLTYIEINGPPSILVREAPPTFTPINTQPTSSAHH